MVGGTWATRSTAEGASTGSSPAGILPLSNARILPSSNLRFRVSGPGFGFWVPGRHAAPEQALGRLLPRSLFIECLHSPLIVSSLHFQVSGSVSRTPGLGLRVPGSEFRVRISGFGCQHVVVSSEERERERVMERASQREERQAERERGGGGGGRGINARILP